MRDLDDAHAAGEGALDVKSSGALKQRIEEVSLGSAGAKKPPDSIRFRRGAVFLHRPRGAREALAPVLVPILDGNCHEQSLAPDDPPLDKLDRANNVGFP